MTENPVIDADKPVRYMMRFFDRLDDPDRNRLTMPEFVQAIGDSLGRRAMTATGIG